MHLEQVAHPNEKLGHFQIKKTGEKAEFYVIKKLYK